MKKIFKSAAFFILVLFILTNLSRMTQASVFDDISKDFIKDKKAKEILTAMVMKYFFGAIGTITTGTYKIDCDYKISIAPSDYAKKISGVNQPVGAFTIYAKGMFACVSPNNIVLDGKSNFIDIQMIKRGKGKAKIAIPANKIYTEVKDFNEIFEAQDKLGEMLPFPKDKKEEGPIDNKKEIKKIAKDNTKVDVKYIGLNQVNNEKVHQIKFIISNKKNNKEIVTIILDATDPGYELRRLSLDHKLVKGSLLLNKLSFNKAQIQDVNAVDSAIKGYKKVSVDNFKEVLYSTLIVNVFKLLK